VTPEERIAELEKHLAEALREIAELRKQLEKWKRGFRERSKRRTSRAEGAKGRRKVAPRKPGQKPGHAPAVREVPTAIDETIHYPTPTACECGGAVDVTDQIECVIEEEIPEPRIHRTEHRAQVGKCRVCQLSVVAKLPGASPDGRPFARVVLGPRAQALALSLRFEHHLSNRSGSRLLRRWFGLPLTHGGISQISLRRARQWGKAKEEIQAHVQQSPVVGVDETGFRQSGQGGYVWLARTPQASYFEVTPSRGGQVLQAMLGDFKGVLVSDFYSVYTSRDDILHSYCGAHLIRKAREIAELDPKPVTQEFGEKLVALYKKGERATDLDVRESVRSTFRWMTTARKFQRHPELARLGNRIANRFEGVVAFLGREDIPWNNNATERDIRSVAVHRKIVGSTRSAHGSAALGFWMSVAQTLSKNGSHLAEWVPGALTSWRAGDDLPTVF
jgi:transposase